jgi:hypothetical protein
LLYAITHRRQSQSQCSSVPGNMTEICDEKLVSLQLCHDVEKDALRVSFVIGANLDLEPIAPGAHVLTVVSQRTDDLFPGEGTKLEHERLCTVAICDPGGLLGAPGREVLEVLIHKLVERSEVLDELEGAEQEE